MLATPGALPDGPGWLFEVLWDGLRVLAQVEDGRLQLTTRDGRDVTAHFPELSGLLDVAPDLVVDGEVVLLEGGVPSVAALADRLHGPVPAGVAGARPVTFMAFDVLRLYGVSLLDRSTVERRATLERLETGLATRVRVSPEYVDGAALLAATAQQGMAGVVAKRRGAPYLPGTRSAEWVAVRHRPTQACVVGGWFPERGAPARVGGLLLGVQDGTGLRYAGRVGAGLAADSTQRGLPPRLVAAVGSPFTQPPPAVDAAGARWCTPVTVVDVTHDGWTAAGRLRNPVFRAFRDDLDPARVYRSP